MILLLKGLALSDKWEDLIERLVQISFVSTARVTEFEISGLRCATSLIKDNSLAVFHAFGSEKL